MIRNRDRFDRLDRDVCGFDRDRRGFDCQRVFNCDGDRRVIRHQHVVRHQHDIINEYDVIHEHVFNHRDVVRTRNIERHNDCRHHRLDYCGERNRDCDFCGRPEFGRPTIV